MSKVGIIRTGISLIAAFFFAQSGFTAPEEIVDRYAVVLSADFRKVGFEKIDPKNSDNNEFETAVRKVGRNIGIRVTTTEGINNGFVAAVDTLGDGSISVYLREEPRFRAPSLDSYPQIEKLLREGGPPPCRTKTERSPQIRIRQDVWEFFGTDGINRFRSIDRHFDQVGLDIHEALFKSLGVPIEQTANGARLEYGYGGELRLRGGWLTVSFGAVIDSPMPPPEMTDVMKAWFAEMYGVTPERVRFERTHGGYEAIRRLTSSERKNPNDPYDSSDYYYKDPKLYEESRRIEAGKRFNTLLAGATDGRLYFVWDGSDRWWVDTSPQRVVEAIGADRGQLEYGGTIEVSTKGIAVVQTVPQPEKLFLGLAFSEPNQFVASEDIQRSLSQNVFGRETNMKIESFGQNSIANQLLTPAVFPELEAVSHRNLTASDLLTGWPVEAQRGFLKAHAAAERWAQSIYQGRDAERVGRSRQSQSPEELKMAVLREMCDILKREGKSFSLFFEKAEKFTDARWTGALNRLVETAPFTSSLKLATLFPGIRFTAPVQKEVAVDRPIDSVEPPVKDEKPQAKKSAQRPRSDVSESQQPTREIAIVLPKDGKWLLTKNFASKSNGAEELNALADRAAKEKGVSDTRDLYYALVRRFSGDRTEVAFLTVGGIDNDVPAMSEQGKIRSRLAKQLPWPVIENHMAVREDRDAAFFWDGFERIVIKTIPLGRDFKGAHEYCMQQAGAKFIIEGNRTYLEYGYLGYARLRGNRLSLWLGASGILGERNAQYAGAPPPEVLEEAKAKFGLYFGVNRSNVKFENTGAPHGKFYEFVRSLQFKTPTLSIDTYEYGDDYYKNPKFQAKLKQERVRQRFEHVSNRMEASGLIYFATDGLETWVIGETPGEVVKEARRLRSLISTLPPFRTGGYFQLTAGGGVNIDTVEAPKKTFLGSTFESPERRLVSSDELAGKLEEHVFGSKVEVKANTWEYNAVVNEVLDGDNFEEIEWELIRRGLGGSEVVAKWPAKDQGELLRFLDRVRTWAKTYFDSPEISHLWSSSNVRTADSLVSYAVRRIVERLGQDEILLRDFIIGCKTLSNEDLGLALTKVTQAVLKSQELQVRRWFKLHSLRPAKVAEKIDSPEKSEPAIGKAAPKTPTIDDPTTPKATLGALALSPRADLSLITAGTKAPAASATLPDWTLVGETFRSAGFPDWYVEFAVSVVRGRMRFKNRPEPIEEIVASVTRELQGEVKLFGELVAIARAENIPSGAAEELAHRAIRRGDQLNVLTARDVLKRDIRVYREVEQMARKRSISPESIRTHAAPSGMPSHQRGKSWDILLAGAMKRTRGKSTSAAEGLALDAEAILRVSRGELSAEAALDHAQRLSKQGASLQRFAASGAHLIGAVVVVDSFVTKRPVDAVLADCLTPEFAATFGTFTGVDQITAAYLARRLVVSTLSPAWILFLRATTPLTVATIFTDAIFRRGSALVDTMNRYSWREILTDPWGRARMDMVRAVLKDGKLELAGSVALFSGTAWLTAATLSRIGVGLAAAGGVVGLMETMSGPVGWVALTITLLADAYLKQGIHALNYALDETEASERWKDLTGDVSKTDLEIARQWAVSHWGASVPIGMKAYLEVSSWIEGQVDRWVGRSASGEAYQFKGKMYELAKYHEALDLLYGYWIGKMEEASRGYVEYVRGHEDSVRIASVGSHCYAVSGMVAAGTTQTGLQDYVNVHADTLLSKNDTEFVMRSPGVDIGKSDSPYVAQDKFCVMEFQRYDLLHYDTRHAAEAKMLQIEGDFVTKTFNFHTRSPWLGRGVKDWEREIRGVQERSMSEIAALASNELASGEALLSKQASADAALTRAIMSRLERIRELRDQSERNRIP